MKYNHKKFIKNLFVFSFFTAFSIMLFSSIFNTYLIRSRAGQDNVTLSFASSSEQLVANQQKTVTVMINSSDSTKKIGVGKLVFIAEGDIKFVNQKPTMSATNNSGFSYVISETITDQRLESVFYNTEGNDQLFPSSVNFSFAVQKTGNGQGTIKFEPTGSEVVSPNDINFTITVPQNMIFAASSGQQQTSSSQGTVPINLRFDSSNYAWSAGVAYPVSFVISGAPQGKKILIFNLKVSYDPALLEVDTPIEDIIDSATGNSIKTNFDTSLPGAVTVNASTGELSLIGYTSNISTAPSQMMIRVKFKTKQNGQGEFKFISAEIKGEDGNYQVNSSSATYTITGTAPGSPQTGNTSAVPTCNAGETYRPGVLYLINPATGACMMTNNVCVLNTWQQSCTPGQPQTQTPQPQPISQVTQCPAGTTYIQNPVGYYYKQATGQCMQFTTQQCLSSEWVPVTSCQNIQPPPSFGAASANVTLNIKLKFQGITTGGKPAMDVKVNLAGIGFTAPISGVVTFTQDGQQPSIWNGRVTTITPTGVNYPYRVFIKGPKHVQKKICEIQPSAESLGTEGTYSCGDGKIILNQGENTLDFSGVYQIVGDVPPQDGVVNARDLAVIRNNLNSSDQSCDVNLDGQCNAQDYALVIFGLSSKPDEKIN